MHHKYLGFEWKGRFFVFTVLPFGLCTACYLFTKLLHPLVHYWREKGLRIVVYLDDDLCTVSGEGAACTANQLVQHTLEQAGFAVHPDKSVWKPTQNLTWLGFVIDMTMGYPMMSRGLLGIWDREDLGLTTRQGRTTWDILGCPGDYLGFRTKRIWD